MDRTTDGTGAVADLTYAQIRALNAADYEPWKGGAYDGAQVASLEEILALARRVGGGLELDIIYEIGEVFKVFGSRLDEYTPESVVAAHDACAVVTGYAGCVTVPGKRWRGAVATFAGDGAVHPSRTRV